MKNYSDVTYKYLRVHKKRTILTILGIILSTALITSIGTMAMSLRDKLIRQAITETGDYYISFSGVGGRDVNKIKNNVDVKTAGVSQNEGTGIVNALSAEDRAADSSAPPYRYLIIKGYDDNAFKMMTPVLKEGRLPHNSNEIAIDYWILQYFPGKPRVGDKIRMDIGVRLGSDGSEMDENEGAGRSEIFSKTAEKEYTIVGLLNPLHFLVSGYMANGVTFIDNVNTSSEKSYNVFVKTISMNNIQSSARAISSKLIGKPEIEFNNDLLRLYIRSTDKNTNTSLILSFAFIILLIIGCTIAVIYNAFNISVLERISQFGILRCVGTSPWQIKRIVLKEAAIMSIIGIPIGLFTGMLAMKLVLYTIGLLNFGLLVDVKIVISPVVLIFSSILEIITVFLSAAGPARQAARFSPMEAVRNSGSIKVGKFKKIKKSIISKLIFGMEGQLASRNLRRNKKRFKITIFSMIISIVLFIVFGGLIDYAFIIESGGNDITSADYELQNYTNSGVDDSVYNELKRIPAVEKVYKSYGMSDSITVAEDKINPLYEKLRGKSIIKNGKVSGEIQHADFISYGDDSLDLLKKYIKSGSINKDVMNKENGIILIQTSNVKTKDNRYALIDITEYKVGDEISVCGPNGKTRRYKVAAILDKGILYNKYGKNDGLEIFMTEDAIKKLLDVKNCYQLIIQAKPDVSHSEITDYLTKLHKKYPGYNYADYEAQVKLFRNLNITISIFLYGFIGVIALIGCLNIVNTISANLILRTKEFAMLRAVGMTRGAIKKMIMLEGIFYGLLAAFYGGIAGTLLYYGLFRILSSIQMIEWAIPWKNILLSAAGALAAALISSLLPMKRISSGVIVEDIRIDN